MQSPGDIGAEEVQPESGRHRRRSHTRQGPRRPPTPAGRPEPGGPARTEGSCPGEESPDRHHSMEEERKKRALWEREPDQPHEETHGEGPRLQATEHGLGQPLHPCTNLVHPPHRALHRKLRTARHTGETRVPSTRPLRHTPETATPRGQTAPPRGHATRAPADPVPPRSAGRSAPLE